ncbi:pilus assembly protein TadG-related protein [Geomesophilobacter sediminis]|uniref:Flp pilus-assembly TadG-like N-terminal domain-containing protein n=1 Tax=Geomesophilobacter sediminis TaxID=2798584 RepID=A0A8J7JM75_9BACT|nr:pilus assembly protein TadG-related protein [Geomesophilobacter sediminis]MBJ6725730.1 hypothetical protein [Geomesophilobacter sediminis]
MDATGKIKPVRNARGMMIVYVSVTLVVLVGMAGMVIDLGHTHVVRGELQNAADASALAGAANLYQQPITAASQPQWDIAKSKAADFVSQNRSDDTKLDSANVEYGYWNKNWKPSDNTPLLPTTSTGLSAEFVPAVKVTVSRTGTENQGPVSTTFMKIFNVNSAPVKSRPAVAVLQKFYAGSVPPHTVFPFAICKPMTDSIFTPSATLPTGEITITSAYSVGSTTCNPAGQWTSLTQIDNSASGEKKLIQNGNDSSLSVGNQIYLQPGEENSVFQTARSAWLNQDVYLPIVDATDLTQKGFQPIVGFAYFHITDVASGSAPYVKGYFTSITTAPSTFGTGGSPSNVTLYKPVMAQ